MADEEKTSPLDKFKAVVKEVVEGVLDDRDKRAPKTESSTTKTTETATEKTDTTTEKSGGGFTDWLGGMFGTPSGS